MLLNPLRNIVRDPDVERAVTTSQHVAKPRLGLLVHFRTSGLPFGPLPPGSGQAVEPTPLQLLHFLVPRVLPARVAKFLGLHPVRMLLPVLGSRVVPVLALVALQRDDFSHRSNPSG